MADQITVRSDGGAPASGASSAGSVSVEKTRQQLAVEALKDKLKGRPIDEQMLQAIVARRERQEAQARQQETVRQHHETTAAVSKRDTGGETGQAGARATLLGKTAETNTPDKLSAQLRSLVTSDPHAPAVLPPISTPQITSQQAGELLKEKMFAYVLPPAGMLTIAGYAETLSPRPATVPGERHTAEGQLQQPGGNPALLQTAQTTKTGDQRGSGNGQQDPQRGDQQPRETLQRNLASSVSADTVLDRPVNPSGTQGQQTGQQSGQQQSQQQPARPTDGAPTQTQPTTTQPPQTQPTTLRPTTPQPPQAQPPQTQPTTLRPTTTQPTTTPPTQTGTGTDATSNGRPATSTAPAAPPAMPGQPQPPLRPTVPLRTSMDVQPAIPTDDEGAPTGPPSYGNAPLPKVTKDRGVPGSFKAQTGTPPTKTTTARPGNPAAPNPGGLAPGRGLRATPMGLEASNSSARLSVRAGAQVPDVRTNPTKVPDVRSTATGTTGPQLPIAPARMPTVTAFGDVNMKTTDNGNTGGGINTTTSWDGMSFNWDAFFIKFMFKFEKDDAEARKLQEEIRDAMHRVAEEGIKAKISIEKMNQAFERAEAAAQLGSALKGLMDAGQKAASDKTFGKDAGATAESRDGGKTSPLDDQIANLTKGFQQQATQSGGPGAQSTAMPGQQDQGPGQTARDRGRPQMSANRSAKPNGNQTDFQAGPQPVLWLSQTQRQQFQSQDPQGFAKYSKLMQQRTEDAGTLGDLALIGAARDRAPPGSPLRAELDGEYTAKAAEVDTDVAQQNGTRTGRSNANYRQRLMQQALIHAFASMADKTGEYSMNGITNIFRQTREYNDRLLLQSHKSDDQIDRERNHTPQQSALGPNGPQQLSGQPGQPPGQDDQRPDAVRGHGGGHSLKRTLGISDGNDTSDSEQSDLDKILAKRTGATPADVQPFFQRFVQQLGNGDEARGIDRMTKGLTALGVPPDVAQNAMTNPDFQRAVSQGYSNQLERTYDVAHGAQPQELGGTTPTERIGHALGGSLAGQALTDARKDHLRDLDKEKKINDIMSGGGGVVAGMADTLRRDLEKANAEAVQAAQKGAGEVDARIRSTYMQAQGLFNQMTHILQMARRGHH